MFRSIGFQRLYRSVTVVMLLSLVMGYVWDVVWASRRLYVLFVDYLQLVCGTFMRADTDLTNVPRACACVFGMLPHNASPMLAISGSSLMPHWLWMCLSDARGI
jgi:hypothetical protein